MSRQEEEDELGSGLWRTATSTGSARRHGGALVRFKGRERQFARKKSRPESRQYAINGIAVHGQSDSGEAGLTVRRGVHEGCQRDARGTTS